MLAVLAIAAAPVAALLGYAATRPRTFRVERGTDVAAPPETIAGYIRDFRRWAAWSPYEKLDPEMKKTFDGASSGVGAVYAWEGRKAGAGRMEITESAPERIRLRLDFTKPFAAHNTAEFTLEPRGAITRVTWSMHGPSPFISRLVGVVINLDRLIGRDFETGLAALKAAAEEDARQPAPALH